VRKGREAAGFIEPAFRHIIEPEIFSSG